MIEFAIVEKPDDNFFQMIPEQRAKIDKLMSEGKILSYTLDASRTKLWCIVNAENEFEAMDLIADFPLISYMVPTILPLLFHNSVFLSIPKFSVN